MHHVCSRLLAVLAIVSTAAVVLLAAAPSGSAATAPRVTNGAKVTPDAYSARWGSIVSIRSTLDLRIDPKATDHERHTCGGTLIAPRLVVTAAHCVAGLDVLPVPGVSVDVLGRTRVLTRRRALPTHVRVQDVYIHPRWADQGQYATGENLDLRFDVAVLRLEAPLDGVTPTPLVRADQAAAWGAGAGLPTGARSAGWGLTTPVLPRSSSDGPPPTVPADLQEVALPIHPDRRCESSDLPMGSDEEYFDRATMLCAGATDTLAGRPSSRTGVCFGDSGGPLIVPDGSGGWALAGVVSWGPSGGGGCNRASVYTRIDGVRDWIETVAQERTPLTDPEPPTTLDVEQSRVNGLRIGWDVAGPAPVRQRLLREVTIGALLEALGVDIDQVIANEELGDRPALRRIVRIPVLLPQGSTGPEERSLHVNAIRPRPRGSTAAITMRVQFRLASGEVEVGPAIRVLRPVDTRPPTRPGVPRVRGTLRSATNLWWPASRDDDCVLRYHVDVRARGARSWRTRATTYTRGCRNELLGAAGQFGRRVPSRTLGGRPPLLDRLATDVSSVRISRGGRPTQVPLYGLAPGAYEVRVRARDRAGNIATSPTSRLRVRTLVAKPTRRSTCFTLGTQSFCIDLDELDGEDEDDGDDE